jgi:NAD(P)-dependent dehydrogenase (short-subunit alcohol dehydrogenase family)
MAADRKTAFVTGAASGIGQAAAAAFIARGYATVLVDRDEARGREVQEALGRGGDCAFVACDVADDESVRRAVAQAVATYGRLDVAFNAAGVGGDPGPLTAQASLENWRRVMDINLTGLWFCLRHEIPAMLESGGGSIVNCASLAGLRGAAGMSAYSASKHGVVGLTKTAALEYAGQGIRVNAVCPGLVDTPMSARVPPAARAAINAVTPLGRFATAEEVASAALWLCDETNSFVTGQAIAVDGGWTAR